MFGMALRTPNCEYTAARVALAQCNRACQHDPRLYRKNCSLDKHPAASFNGIYEGGLLFYKYHLRTDHSGYLPSVARLSDQQRLGMN